MLNIIRIFDHNSYERDDDDNLDLEDCYSTHPSNNTR